MLINYLKMAWKVLGRNPFFTLISLFGISLTIGILLVVNALFDHFAGAHYPDVNRDRTLYINSVRLTDGNNSSWSGGPSFHLLHDYVKKFESPALVAIKSSFNTTNTFVQNKKLSLQQRYTCENFWEVYGFNFLEGQPYRKENMEANDYVAVITQATKEDYFEGEEKVVGKTILIDDTAFRVIGVVQNVSQARIDTYADVYIPYHAHKGNYREKKFIDSFSGVLLADSPKDFPQIKAEYAAFVEKVEVPLPQEWMQNYKIMDSKALEPLGDATHFIFGIEDNPSTTIQLFLFTVMFLFMLLPAMNLVNLNSSRISERSSEIGVRKAFGATSSTLAVQFIIENIVLTILGGLIGILIAWGVLNAIESTQILKHLSLGINFRLLFFALGLCFFFGVLSGVLPAWRMSKIQIVNALKGNNL